MPETLCPFRMVTGSGRYCDGERCQWWWKCVAPTDHEPVKTPKCVEPNTAVKLGKRAR